MEMILFINSRLVECPSIKKAVEFFYSNYLPPKFYPFVYLSLEMPQRYVDVNVHPTKETVEFLNERAIVERICQELKEKIDATLKCKTGVVFEVAKTIQPLQVEEPQKATKPKSGPSRSNVSLSSVQDLRTQIDAALSVELQVKKLDQILKLE
jgi:DNA mismatch repair ATPase MutL